MLQLNSDNMKNKGFTLIELIITITLIAIISVTVGVSVSNMLSNQKEKDAEDMKATIENAACVYVEVENEGTTCPDDPSKNCVSLDELIKSGLLDNDLNNPLTNEDLDINSMVKISWENNEKKCEYEFAGLN